MTAGAKSDQVPLGILSRVTPEPLMMYFEVRHRAASLTPPVVPAQNLLSELFVRLAIDPQYRASRQDRVHDAFSVK